MHLYYFDGLVSAQHFIFIKNKTMHRFISLCAFFCLFATLCMAKSNIKSPAPGEADTAAYYNMLRGKKIGLLINQSATYNDTLLLDRLMQQQIMVVKIFVPEHGFRGTEDAGTEFGNSTDKKTGLPIISLYGKHKKPTQEDLQGIDILVYDLQDVGVRFYTYVSTLQYCMEACAENKVSLVVMDRLNPNGFYVDGPVLDTENRSFVGMQPVPIVYGMTAGEYALMLKGEQWSKNTDGLDLKVIKCLNYTHKTTVPGYLPPSPNLRTWASLIGYPSMCLFEGTKLSVGRGTDSPFLQFGAPELKGSYKYSFTPTVKKGATKPLYENKTCYGFYIGNNEKDLIKKMSSGMYLQWILNAYNKYPDKEHFFNDFFIKLAGSKTLEQQIKAGKTDKEIKASWQPKLNTFKVIRKKYLLYSDF